MLARIFLITVSCLSLMACATHHNYTPAEQKEHKMVCFEQAQDVYNAPVNIEKPYENALYATCMKARFGYEPEDLPAMH